MPNLPLLSHPFALAASDFFKNKVLEQFPSDLSVLDVLLSLASSFVISLLILFIYRVTFRGVLFSKSFAFSLSLLSMITSLVILTISSNLALSLGMVGALSIVRFRTAVKDPADTIFMFWAIANGIITGAGLYVVAAVASACIGALYILVSYIVKRRADPYLLIIRYDTDYEKNITWLLQRLPKYRMRSKTVTGTDAELALELALTDKVEQAVAKAQSLEGVSNISLVSYESEFGL
ncbi:MAG: DUF4956 domain-containing protein [Oscillospiraceae bacterium]|jgi:uncharacterized membrane protein YhiD involved in acid resistance|nr:DUF4956 domain-containing protein [Oscillospiraceae bacterium]